MTHKIDREEKTRLRLIEEENNKLPPEYMARIKAWEEEENTQRLEGEDIKRKHELKSSLQPLNEYLQAYLADAENYFNTFPPPKVPLLAFVKGPIETFGSIVAIKNILAFIESMTQTE